MTREFKVGISAPSIIKTGGTSSQYLMADGSITTGGSGPLTQTALSSGFSIAGGTTSKTLQINNTITLAGTDSTTMTFPAISGTVATLNTANIFTADQTINGLLIGTPSAGTSKIQTPAVSATATPSSNIEIITGNATGSGISYPGYIRIDTGTGTSSANTVEIGNINASGVQIGKASGYVSFNSILYVNQGSSTQANIFTPGGTGTPNYTTPSISIYTGSTSGATVVSGSISIDAGTATGSILGTAGSINIGTANASAVTIGRSGKTTTVNGPLVAASIAKSGGASNQYLMADGSVSTNLTSEIIPLDDISNEINGQNSRFLPKYQGQQITINNPLRLLVTINGIIQTVGFTDNTWQSFLPKDGFVVDNDGYIAFSEVPPLGSSFHGRLMAGSDTTSRSTTYPFRASDILLGE